MYEHLLFSSLQHTRSEGMKLSVVHLTERKLLLLQVYKNVYFVHEEKRVSVDIILKYAEISRFSNGAEN